MVYYRCDGGVGENSFLMQFISDLTDCTLDRPEHHETTSLGAAFIAGLVVGTTYDTPLQCFCSDFL